MIPEIEGKKTGLRAVTIWLVMVLCMLVVQQVLPVVQQVLADGNKNSNAPRKSKQKAKQAPATKQEILAGCDEDFQFSGVIQTLPTTSGFIGDWMVSGRVIHVITSTGINQQDYSQIKVG